MADDLKVFISWSGPFARAVAVFLRDWLGNLSDRIEPWVSDVDIEAGTRSMDELASELTGTHFGIIIVTQDNQNAPWLNFEAGALSKQVEGVKARVAPLLMDMKNSSDLVGPISQYQANVFSKPGVSKLIQSLGKVAGVEKATILSRYDKYWPDLEAGVDRIRATQARRGVVETRRTDRELLEEAVVLIRGIQRMNLGFANVHREPVKLAGTPQNEALIKRIVIAAARRRGVEPREVLLVLDSADPAILIDAGDDNERLTSEGDVSIDISVELLHSLGFAARIEFTDFREFLL